MKRVLTHLSIILCLGMIVFVLDQWSKDYVFNYIQGGVTGIKVTSFLSIILTWNYGISFGVMNDPDQNQWFFTVLSGVIVLALLIWALKSKDIVVAVAVGIIAGGAIGNVVDRFNYGAVLDFIDFHINSWHYPTFNIADSAIFIGVIIAVFWPTSEQKSIKGQ